jgi:hypothetical protein
MTDAAPARRRRYRAVRARIARAKNELERAKRELPSDAGDLSPRNERLDLGLPDPIADAIGPEATSADPTSRLAASAGRCRGRCGGAGRHRRTVSRRSDTLGA